MSWSFVVAIRFDFGDNLRSLSLGAEVLVDAYHATYYGSHSATYDYRFGVGSEIESLIHEPYQPANNERDSEHQPASLESLESQSSEACLHEVGSQGAFGR